MKYIDIETGDNYPIIKSAIPGQSLRLIEKTDVIRLFKQYGVVLIRGFSVDQQSFNEMTSQYCSGFVMNKLRGRATISKDGRTQSVNLSPVAFPLHPEMSQVPWRPDIAWFACTSPPSKNGETTLCDGIAIVRNLDHKTRSQLENRFFIYKKKATIDEFEFWTGRRTTSAQDLENPEIQTPYAFSIRNGELFKTFITPALYKPMFSDKLAFGSFLLFRRLLHNDLNSPKFEDESIIPDSLFRKKKRSLMILQLNISGKRTTY
jgi:hypothetical protein